MSERTVTIIPTVNLMGYKRHVPVTLPEDEALFLLDSGKARVADEESYEVPAVAPKAPKAAPKPTGQVASTVVGTEPQPGEVAEIPDADIEADDVLSLDDLLDDEDDDARSVPDVYDDVMTIDKPTAPKPRQSKRRRPGQQS